MAFVPAPNVVLVELRALLSGEHVENRIHVNCLHEPTSADLVDIATGITNAYTSDWLSLMPTTWVANEIFLRSLHEENAIQLTVPLGGAPWTGTHASPQLPNNCTLCVSLRSSFAGRSARGRLYWQALCEDQVDQNTVVTTPAGLITDAVRAIDVEMTALGFDFCIVSYINNGVPRVGGPVYFSINSVIIVDPIVDSQRRRLPGRGN
jgi:hypothetical protein